VQIEFLRGVLSGLEEKAHRAGVARLLLRLEQSRRAMQPDVLKAVDRFGRTGVTHEMLAAAEKARCKRKKRSAGRRSRYVLRQAEEHVCIRLNGVAEYEESLDDPDDHQQHHAMRIAAKRLRYTMEIYQPVYEGRLDRFVKEVKNLQTLLGDIHDCDVWGEHLDAFMGEERERTIAYFGHARPFGPLKIGLDHLREDRRREREARFRQLGEHWRELNQNGFWEELIQTLRWVDEPCVRSERAHGAHAAGAGHKRSVPRPGDDQQRRIDDPQGQTSPTKDRHLGPSVPDAHPGRQYVRLPGGARTERSES
jgi:hypothetical protein